MTKLKRVGLMTENLNARHYIAQAQVAERMGFDSFWVPEDYAYPGAFSACGAIAASTSKIKIGTGVVNPFTRHPVVTAMELAALDQLSNGRAVLGLGGGIKLWIEEQMAIPYVKPIAALRDAVTIIRRLFAGEALDYQGKVACARAGIRFNLEPQRADVPIMLGATGPKALELAGELADGMMPVCASPEGIRKAVECVRTGAARVARNLDGFEFSALLVASIDTDGHAAREATKPLLATILGWFANQPELSIFTDYGLAPADVNEIRMSYRRGEIRPEFVSEALIDGLTVSGSPARCREQLARLIDAGLTSAIFMPANGLEFEQGVQLLHRELLQGFI